MSRAGILTDEPRGMFRESFAGLQSLIDMQRSQITTDGQPASLEAGEGNR